MKTREDILRQAGVRDDDLKEGASNRLQNIRKVVEAFNQTETAQHIGRRINNAK